MDIFFIWKVFGLYTIQGNRNSQPISELKSMKSKLLHILQKLAP